jgi:putative transcriptional regulator
MHTPQQIASLRASLALSQIQFAQLFGVHFMTVSKWERGLVAPSPYQSALMDQFTKTAEAKREQAKDEVGKLLLGAGVVAALVWLLSGASKG